MLGEFRFLKKLCPLFPFEHLKTQLEHRKFFNMVAPWFQHNSMQLCTGFWPKKLAVDFLEEGWFVKRKVWI